MQFVIRTVTVPVNISGIKIKDLSKEEKETLERELRYTSGSRHIRGIGDMLSFSVGEQDKDDNVIVTIKMLTRLDVVPVNSDGTQPVEAYGNKKEKEK